MSPSETARVALLFQPLFLSAFSSFFCHLRLILLVHRALTSSLAEKPHCMRGRSVPLDFLSHCLQKHCASSCLHPIIFFNTDDNSVLSNKFIDIGNTHGTNHTFREINDASRHCCSAMPRAQHGISHSRGTGSVRRQMLQLLLCR
jgi:hypothetical protein